MWPVDENAGADRGTRRRMRAIEAATVAGSMT